MAGDTQESAPPNPAPEGSNEVNPQDPSSQRKKPRYETQTQVGKLWDAFGDPEQSANTLATANNPRDNDGKDVTVSGVIKSLSFENIKSFYKAPCARDSLLLGIGGGFAGGGLRSILGGMSSVQGFVGSWLTIRLGTRSLSVAANWAVGAFAIASVASYEFCQRRRRMELDGMKQAAELMKELKIKKEREKRKAVEERRAAEEERKRKSWTNLSNYKFW